jgi:alkylation response protein AidB-like acyl-CoA dehydrogenase
MDLTFSDDDEAFRARIRAWLEAQLTGEFAALRGRGGPGDDDAMVEARMVWERHLGKAGYIGIGWPKACGGAGLSLTQQVLWSEEYARAEAPGRVGHIGETLIGPTICAFGTEEQKQRFLPGILAGTEFWCQGYSEPNAGSDLANVQTRAVRDGDAWVVTGQKVWTSGAHWSDWCFVLCRTEPTAPKHRGLSYLLVPMKQPGVEIRPIQQLTGSSEFNEVFFDGARTEAANVVGGPGGGWKVAMGTLAFERGVSTLGQQLFFRNEFAQVIEAAKANGAARDPRLRQRLAKAWMGLEIMRLNALRMLSNASAQGGELGREAMITKLYWSEWHRELGELAMDVLGADAEITEPNGEPTPLQRLYLFSRADTIYAGSSEIQRNLIGERALGLPPEPKAIEVPKERA